MNHVEAHQKILSSNGLTLGALHALIALDEEGSLRTAAQAIVGPLGDIESKAAQMSKQIAQLEAFFDGKRLKERHGRGIRLTNEGKALARVVRRFFGDLTAAMDTHGPKPISLGAGEAYLQWMVIPRIKTLRTLPGVGTISVFNVRSQQAIRWIHEDRLQYAIIRADGPLPSLRQDSLGLVQYAYFIPKFLLKKHFGNPEATPGEQLLLRHIPMATLSNSSSFGQRLTTALQKDPRSFPALGTNTFPEAAEALKTGAMGSVLPKFAQKALSETDFYVCNGEILNSMTHEIQLVYRPSSCRIPEKLADLLALHPN